MTNIILLLICLLIGLLLQRNKSLPKDSHVALNTVILHVPLPAIALLNIPLLEFDMSLMALALTPWVIFILSYFLIPMAGRRFHFDRATIGCLILTAGLGNTSFVGFPILEALYGKSVIKYGVVLDQLGTFLIMSVAGIWVATRYSSGDLKISTLAKKIFFFPPFIAFFVALLLWFSGWKAEGMTKDILGQLAMTLTPLALISVGLQLRVKEMGTELKPLLVGLGFKLFLAPVVIFLLLKIFNTPVEIFKVSVVEAAMAPMITAAIVASSYSLNSRLCGLMVGVGVPASLVTSYVWSLIVAG